MQPKSDAQLLREYAEHRSEGAFAELVARHTNLVYSAAMRQLDSADYAAEVAQQVFIGLAHSARALTDQLTENASLAGWLCRSARNLSLNIRRAEFRRHTRERQAMAQMDSTDDDIPDWTLLGPALDAAMSELSESDYDAIVLRFFKNQELRKVGQALGVTDDTAQKRISRALKKLHDLLYRRGITTSATALSLRLSAHAVQAAPFGLAATISTAAALHGTTPGTPTTATITKGIIMNTNQKTIFAAAVFLLCGAATVVVNNQMKPRTSASNAAVVNLDDYVGRFEMPGRRIDIQRKDAGISVFIDGQPAFVAYPQSPGKFVSRDHGSITQLMFGNDAAGRPVQFTLVRDGRELGELKRPDNF